MKTFLMRSLFSSGLFFVAVTSGYAQSGVTVTIDADQPPSYRLFHSDGTPARESNTIYVDIPGLQVPVGTKIRREPLAGVKVSMEQDVGGKIISQGTTDRNGDFVFKPAKPGRYTLRLGDGLTDKRAIGIIAIDKVGPVRSKWARYWRTEIQSQ